MFTMNAYAHLEKTIITEKISEKYFYALIIYFHESFIDEIDFKNRLKKHRKPVEFLNQVLRGIYNDIHLIQMRPEMIDIDGNQHGYVPTKVVELWEEDEGLGNLYFSTEKYCQLRNKDFSTIAVHIAEYRAINKLASRISRQIKSLKVRHFAY